jgi:hypothetical protein
MVALGLAAPLSAQTCTPGELRVLVTDSQESVIPEAEVRVASDDSFFSSLSTQIEGLAEMSGVPCGAWKVAVTKDGFDPATETIQMTNAGRIQIRLVLTPKKESTSVEVSGAPPPLEQSAAAHNELEPGEVKSLPTNPATVGDALPLIPGILRTARGELRIDGTGPERSAMVVNQSDITDPATGRFGQTLPIDSIESVNVLNTPFLAQYGRSTQTVVAVETKRGGEKWHAALNDPVPDIRILSGHFRGIRNENPRFVGGGPLMRNRVYVISAVEYRIDKVPNRTLGFPGNVSKQESLNSFTQIDIIPSSWQQLTATFHYSPQRTNFVNPDFFTPQPVTPSFVQQSYVGTLVYHLGIFGGILDSGVSLQSFDAMVGAQGPADMVLAPQGDSGNYFGTQHRSSTRREWLETWSLAPIDLFGTHLLKFGSSLTTLGDQGQFRFRPVDIAGATGVLEQQIDFTNQNPYNRNDLEITAYAQDHWAPLKQLSFDVGARIEHQRLASSLKIAPREGLSWSPFSNRRTVFRAGYGQFYDHLPLDIYTFGRYPIRTITTYAPDGTIVGEPVVYDNVIGSVTGPHTFLVQGRQVAGAFSPRGATLNLQAEHIFSRLVRVRLKYTDNQSVGLEVLDPGELGPQQEIVLNGDGKSRYRQFESTARLSRKDSQLTLSYTRSYAEGSLNTFDSFLGNFPLPVVRPDIRTTLPDDVPNRFLAWGHVNLHIWGVSANPIVEYRNGLPYARLDVLQNYVGIPYGNSTRFPNFFSADARFIKDVKLNAKYTVRVSVTASNMTNHFNALAVHDNIADPLQGVFFGNFPRRYRGDFEVVF